MDTFFCMLRSERNHKNTSFPLFRQPFEGYWRRVQQIFPSLQCVQQTMTTTIQLYCRVVCFFESTTQDNEKSWEGADFVFQWWVFSLSIGGPLCSILHHCKASVQVANLSAWLSWFTMEWRKRPHYQGHFSFVLPRQNIFFKSILSNTKRITSSPKINNVHSYTTHLLSALWIWMESMTNAALRLSWQLQSPNRAYHWLCTHWSFRGWVVVWLVLSECRGKLCMPLRRQEIH